MTDKIQFWFPSAAKELDFLVDSGSESALALAKHGMTMLKDKKGNIAGVEIPNEQFMLDGLLWQCGFRLEILTEDEDSRRYYRSEISAWKRIIGRLEELGAQDVLDPRLDA